MTSDSAPHVSINLGCNMLTSLQTKIVIVNKGIPCERRIQTRLIRTYYSRVKTDGDEVAGKTPVKPTLTLSNA